MQCKLFLLYGIMALCVASGTPAGAESVFATAAKVDGSVTFTAPETGLVRMMAQGARIAEGAVVTVGTGGLAELQLTPCSAVQVTPDSVMRLDKLQLIRKDDAFIARAAEITCTAGSSNYIIEGLVTRVNLPGLLLTAQHAAFAVRIRAGGEVMVVLFSGMATLTDPQGQAVELRGGSFAVATSGGVGVRRPVQGDLGAEAVLSSVVGFLDKAYFLSLICEDTLVRMRGEYLQIPVRIVQAEQERANRRGGGGRRPAARTVVSPEQ